MAGDDYPHAINVGPVGRLGRWTATHFKLVLVAWVMIAVGLGAFAPRVETALAGAGWDAIGSPSVQARHLIEKHFGGQSSYGLMVVVHSQGKTVADPAFRAVLARTARALRADPAVTRTALPRPGLSISRGGHTAIIQAGAARSANGMVKAAGELEPRLARLSRDGVQVHLTGAAAMWSDFNNANRTAMMRSEIISWPVTLAILLVAFGS